MESFWNYENYIFDFDGVILDSNKIKSSVFLDVLKNYPEDSLKRFEEYNNLNGGVPRDEKFFYFFRVIMKMSAEEVKVRLKESLKNFSDLLYSKLLTADFVPGVKDLLSRLKNKNKLILIWTGGLEKEVQKLLFDRKINNYFNGLYGAPGAKKMSMDRICRDYMLSKEKTIVIGDSLVDYEVALEKEFSFLFISGYTAAALICEYSVEDFLSL